MKRLLLATFDNPTVNPDKSVTFTFSAPDAAKVEIEGGFLPPREIETPWGKMQVLVCVAGRSVRR